MSKELTTAAFEQDVVNAAKPVLVDFWASWCGPCRALGPVVEQIGEEMADRLDVYKCNVDEEGELAQRFGIMSIPLVILFKDGKAVKQSLGYKPIDALKAELGI